jgi:hypothetical protein
MTQNPALAGLYLRNIGEGVLARLYHAKVLSNPATRPTLIDPNNRDYGRVIKKLSENFPSEPRDIERVSFVQASFAAIIFVCVWTVLVPWTVFVAFSFEVFEFSSKIVIPRQPLLDIFR